MEEYAEPGNHKNQARKKQLEMCFVLPNLGSKQTEKLAELNSKHQISHFTKTANHKNVVVFKRHELHEGLLDLQTGWPFVHFHASTTGKTQAHPKANQVIELLNGFVSEIKGW